MAVQRVPGVLEAVFSYDEARGFVRYYPDVTDPSTFMAELEQMTGFEARLSRADTR